MPTSHNLPYGKLETEKFLIEFVLIDLYRPLSCLKNRDMQNVEGYAMPDSVFNILTPKRTKSSPQEREVFTPEDTRNFLGTKDFGFWRKNARNATGYLF
jgi:hypothetical protein